MPASHVMRVAASADEQGMAQYTRAPAFCVKETDMDLIDLYHLRGISLVRSKLSRTAAARRGYCRLARRYAEQIEDAGALRRLEASRAMTPAL